MILLILVFNYSIQNRQESITVLLSSQISNITREPELLGNASIILLAELNRVML